MKIPSSFVIKGRTWKVRFRKKIIEKGEECHGLCFINKRIIYIEKGLDKDLEAVTFMHEFFHACVYELHLALDSSLEETLVDGFADCLIQSFSVHPKGV